MKPVLYLLLPLLFFFSSCAIHHGNLVSSTNSTAVVHKDIAFGTSESTHWFGIGGIKKDALVYQARQDMMRNRTLTGSEQYNNITVDTKHSFFLFYHKLKITIYADIVEPKGSPSDPSYSDLYRLKTQGGSLTLTEVNLEDELLKMGDTIYYNRYDRGVIVSLNDPRKVTVSTGVVMGVMKTKTKNRKSVFALPSAFRGLTLGDTTSQGIIRGFNKKNYLVESAEGVRLIFPFE